MVLEGVGVYLVVIVFGGGIFFFVFLFENGMDMVRLVVLVVFYNFGMDEENYVVMLVVEVVLVL